ncbi:DUF6087 family protein [Streptomyces sp. ISL-96]|uniref:DUF6087 family protein n=1 Tax=Streptomyces sp. ISL-96 TaxID=2819191 RepID=UPI0027E247B7|nr:DUF6087 family protein [Streptomyces sp. ISL-96]
MERWNGHAWGLHTIASNLAEAQRILHPDTAGTTSPVPGTAPSPLGPGPASTASPKRHDPTGADSQSRPVRSAAPQSFPLRAPPVRSGDGELRQLWISSCCEVN